ncbi:type VI secretion system transmembrane protein TssO [Paenibacillus sp. ACRRX]|uniref:GAF domain-containing protein n=1 Tax=unclassified Paenibacillus TaxID=185978 RepID=UPI001EF6BEC3|nr:MULTISPECIES: type VI secretion system transmembrane protein TssO [unclassified Paenibacillus]MCG7407565.1 type VI secretion system transmembrane protein TssO [Paenibacillus sp. ACRRX]MDK8180800.1 type VI secretion system transmembrane protein TssO [Paenibacillus sp. UMB4589-SE434]
MEAIIKAMLEKLPPWGYHLFTVVISAGIIFYFFKTLYINKKLSDMVSDVMTRDERMQTYQEKLDTLRTSQMDSEHAAQQSLSALRNLKTFTDTCSDLRMLLDPYMALTESAFLLQRMLDMLAIDMKMKPGGHHRCGIWLYADQTLTLRFASAGFPKKYVGERQLHVDRSVAGRSFRKQTAVHCSDVKKDEDWERNLDSKSPYQSLLCLSLGVHGVLTIDGLEPFHEAGRVIADMYASLMIGVLADHAAAFQLWAASRLEEQGGNVTA